MVNLRRLADRAREQINKRGGSESVKEDADELKDIAKGEGSLKHKAKAAAKAVKDPGAEGSDTPKR
ncbi:MAG TPA: hypothetical protein VHH72_02245 [Solirubrobacterales bacterium]|jgi:hypothetical protein|nr:hypothetical protein [Solirubrobacterales bacterium]